MANPTNISVAEQVKRFKKYERQGLPLSSLEWEIVDMAQGGTANDIRAEYYPDRSDRYFRLICEGMGWEWRK